MSSKAARASNKATPKKCDICDFPNGRDGMMMIICRACKVQVHKECVGMPTFQKKKFTCIACRSVGRKFQVEVYKAGRRLKLRQTKRPTQCELCSVQTGIHSMHPLYDNHGTKGRQLFRVDLKPRLLWAHSLCALSLATKGIALYGTTREGDYDKGDDESSDDDDEEDGWSDDNRSENSELLEYDSDEELCGEDFAPVHHFVYCLRQEGERRNEWTRAAEIRQWKLKCEVCGIHDKPALTPETESKLVFNPILRVPVQCMAHNRTTRRFQSMEEGDCCPQAMHVGCARWGGVNPQAKSLVAFSPMQNNTGETGALFKIFCICHARELRQPQSKSAATSTSTQKHDKKRRAVVTPQDRRKRGRTHEESEESESDSDSEDCEFEG